MSTEPEAGTRQVESDAITGGSASAGLVPFGQDPVALRKLFIYMLAGNAQVVQQRAGQVTLRRPTLWGKARRHLRKVWRTITGKERKKEKS